MRKQAKKLVLAKETLRGLDLSDRRQVYVNLVLVEEKDLLHAKGGSYINWNFKEDPQPVDPSDPPPDGGGGTGSG